MSAEIKQLEEQLVALKKQLTEARRRVQREPIQDYAFTNGRGRAVRLSDLFGDKDDLLVVHNMGVKCPYCTLWADGFIGVARHLEDRAGFVLSSPDDYKLMNKFAGDRKWNFRVVSHKGSTFARDMGFEREPGKFWPGVSAFRRMPDGSIERTGHALFGPGDDFCSVWPLFDLLAEGAAGWEPKYRYEKAQAARPSKGAPRRAPRRKSGRKAARRAVRR